MGDGDISLGGSTTTVKTYSLALGNTRDEPTIFLNGTSGIITAKNLYITGNITGPNEDKSIFAGVDKTITIGGTNSQVVVQNLHIGTGYPGSGSSFTSNGDVKTKGDLNVDGTVDV